MKGGREHQRLDLEMIRKVRGLFTAFKKFMGNIIVYFAVPDGLISLAWQGQSAREPRRHSLHNIQVDFSHMYKLLENNA